MKILTYTIIEDLSSFIRCVDRHSMSIGRAEIALAATLNWDGAYGWVKGESRKPDYTVANYQTAPLGIPSTESEDTRHNLVAYLISDFQRRTPRWALQLREINPEIKRIELIFQQDNEGDWIPKFKAHIQVESKLYLSADKREAETKREERYDYYEE